MRILALLAAVLGLTTLAAPVAAQPVALTASDLNTYLDGYMPYALQRGDVAGAVVVVVKDGQVLFEKGYGYADVAARKPVDPQTTVFRTGSVSKLFTWTAVMQQVEAGKLDLDKDVNTYLDFKIPPYEGQPVTLRQLMSHTAGFAEVLGDLFSSTPDKITPDLRGYLVKNMPRRIFAPGKVTAYSNYGASLSAYLVQRVSGEAYADYVQRHIFDPLGMSRSSFYQPLPAALRPDIAKGYLLGSGEQKPFEMVTAVPAGANSATGADMARFMLAYLQGGGTILKPETVKTIFESPTTIVPGVNRMLLGFYEEKLNGRRVLGHGGDTFVFHTEMMLFPDDNVGVFLAVNSTGNAVGSGVILKDLLARFADRYLPGEVRDGSVAPAVAKQHAAMMQGLYEGSVRYDNFFSLLKLMSQSEVTANDDGTISFAAFETRVGTPKRWREIAPFLWREVGGKDFLSAKVENGKVVMFTADETSTSTIITPVPWWKSSGWIVPTLLLSLGALAFTVLVWPAAALIRWRSAATFPLTGTEARAFRFVRLSILAVVALFVTFVLTLTTMTSDFSMLRAANDWWIWTLHILALVVFFGGLLVAAWNAVVVWRGRRGWFAKLWSAVLLLSTVVVLWVAVVFQLIAFSANY
jgi:CubicO group peptidase (beta-lactamase class C family)